MNKLVLLVIFILGFSLNAQESKEAFLKKHYILGSDTLSYRILFPKNFDENKQYPLLLFLHGAGERGSDNERQLTHGADLFLNEENRENYPAIVVFPQVPKSDYWAQVDVRRDTIPFQFNFRNQEAPTTSMKLAMQLMDEMKAENFTDDDRIYIGGLSMGGMGTYEMLYRKPEMFAAAFAICGGADTEIVKNYQEGLDIWIFHGETDNVVLPEYSKAMAREINHHGGNAKVSLYPNDNHNSWDSAFAEPYLMEWLFSHHKSEKTSK